MQLRLVTSDCLGHEHLDYSDHAPPTHVLALGELAIGKPDDFFKGVEEFLARLVVVGTSEKTDFLVPLKLKFLSGEEGLNQAIVFEGEGQVDPAYSVTYSVVLKEDPFLRSRSSVVDPSFFPFNSYLFPICIIMLNCHRKGPFIQTTTQLP